MRSVERSLAQVASMVGDPLSVDRLQDNDGHCVAISRWRYGDQRYEILGAKDLRLVITLGGRSEICHSGSGKVMRVASVPGTMRVFAPGFTSKAMVTGCTDILIIYIAVDDLGFTTGRWWTPAFLDLVDERVRAAAVTTFVAARAGHVSRSRNAATALRHDIGGLFRSLTHAQERPRTGGLRPTACRRIESLIERRLDRQSRLPSVEELAEETALSVNHFIRAFREETGTTPYQHLIVRRQQRVMSLLGEPGLSIADVADLVGFSSPAHFVASFRKKLGVTPGAFREAVLGSGHPSGAPIA